MRRFRDASKLAVILGLLFCAAAGLIVLLLPMVGESFHYLIAGTFGSAVTLAAAFALFVSGRLS